jgi:hypothetical protein
MRARLTVVLIGSMLVAAAQSWAGDSSEVSGGFVPASVEVAAVTGSVDREAPVEPWIHSNMPADVREKLQAAVRIAAVRIEEVEECGELFFRLDADGREMLKATLYIPVASYNRKDGICRRAAAYTKVGARSTFICPEFSRLSDERAAMFVVHEALHHAGLTEKPQYRRGMTSLAINSMVGRSCGF